MNILNTVQLIILLPCLISSQIQVQILPGTDEKNPTVFVSGSARTNATSIDLAAFHITNHEVKANLKRLKWWVGVVNVSHASAYGYRDLDIKLKAKQARIQSAKVRTVIFDQEVLSNKATSSIQFRPEIIQDVLETMTFKWYEQKVVSVGQHIHHSLGHNRLEHVSAYGQEDFASKMETVVATYKEDIVLETGDYIKPVLDIKETTLVVRIDYELSLDGDLYYENGCIADNYCFKKNHLDVNEYFKLLDYSPIINSYEVVTVTYYHDPRVLIMIYNQ